MKKLLLLFLLFILLLTACGQTAGGTQQGAVFPTPDWESIPNPLPPSMKGYELYSWQTDGGWMFTLISGTNRSKSFDEITAPGNTTTDDGMVKITVNSLEDLAVLLRRLPAGEEVFWGGIDLSDQVSEGTLYFSYPPEENITQILRLAEEIGITIHTLQNQ